MARILIFLFILALSLLSGCSHLGSKQWRPEYKVFREKLDNGLTVLYVEDHAVPVVSYTTWFRVGSAWEKPGATGIAHLFEHMMFKGTPRFSGKEFFKKLESKGAQVNAYTQRDATVYYEVIASENLEMVIDMESDRLINLKIEQKDLDAERQVVKEERRLRVDSNFGAQQMEELQKLAFPTHPYGWPVIGYQEDLDRMSLQQCRSFFADYYQPGNAIITISGDFDLEKTRKLMRKYYGPIKGHEVSKLKLAEEKHPAREIRKEIRKPVQSETLVMGYYIPSMYHDDANTLAMLGWAAFGLSSSRATMKLVREKQIALGVWADAGLERFPFLFLVGADMKNGIPAQIAEEELDLLIAELKEKPISDEELDRVKNKILYSTVNEGKSPSGFSSWLASGEFYWQNHNHIFEILESYKKITPDDLRRVARKYLNKENRVVVVMKPEEKSFAVRGRK